MWRVRGEIVQRKPFYELDLTLELKTETEKLKERVGVSGEGTTFVITCDAPPEKLLLDPDFDTFRQLDPSEIPPSINSIKGSGSVLVILAGSSRQDMEDAAKTLILSLGLKNFRIVREDRVEQREILRDDILLVGLPEMRFLPLEFKQEVSIGKEEFALDGRRYGDPSDVFFGVFAHPRAEGRVMALFLPLSGAYAREVGGGEGDRN